MPCGAGFVLLWLLLGASPFVAEAASSTTKTTTSTFLLPSIPTSASEQIYATLLTAGEATTLWALGCQPDVGAATPTCTGAFRPRPTLTSGPSTLHLVVGGGGGGGDSVYDCTRNAPASDNSADGSGLTCQIKTGAATNTFSTTTLTDASAWMTNVTVIGDAKVKTTSKRSTTRIRTTTITRAGGLVTSVMTEMVEDAATSATKPSAATTTPGGAGGNVCKRKVGAGGSGAGDASAGNGADGGDAAGVNGGTTSTKGNNDGGGCSAGSRLEGGLLFVSGLAGICLMVLIVAI
ncbi:hypothetical protein PG996_008214 [Apiospora saccharicola]|uniref:Uncharacterized protein n=1 Tax=Apiospora saccharicola TaxID=335842 RepID=A0ABR1UXY9_9PEZI